MSKINYENEMLLERLHTIELNNRLDADSTIKHYKENVFNGNNEEFKNSLERAIKVFEIRDMITNEVEKEAMRTGKMGTETVNINLHLEDEEIEIFQNEIDLDELEGNWFWEVEENILSVGYSEE